MKKEYLCGLIYFALGVLVGVMAGISLIINSTDITSDDINETASSITSDTGDWDIYQPVNSDNKLNDSEQELFNISLEDPNNDIYIYLGSILDLPSKKFYNNKYGYSYRSILDNIFPKGEWTYIDHSNDKMIEMYAQFSVYEKEIGGYFKVIFKYTLRNDQEYSECEIISTLNGDEIAGGELFKSIMGDE